MGTQQLLCSKMLKGSSTANCHGHNANKTPRYLYDANDFGESFHNFFFLQTRVNAQIHFIPWHCVRVMVVVVSVELPLGS